MPKAEPRPRALLLFDIDGTILLTGGAGMRCMVRAGREVFGPSMSWEGIELSGGLDPLLVAEAAARSGLPFCERSHGDFRTRYLDLLPGELRAAGAQVRILPGVREVIDALRGRADAVLGLLTGNYPEGATCKLAAVGIDPSWFPVTAFGDEAPSRPALVAVALGKLAAREGRAPDPGRVIVIGDSPRDVDAALRNGCRAFAVATGKYGMEELLAAGAHRVVRDLSDPSPLLELLR
jgi:phosphoglycolate phosphatase